MKKPQPQPMTVKDVADFLGITPMTVRDQLRDGVMTGQKFGRDWSVDREEVLRYQNEHLGKVGRPRTRKRRKTTRFVSGSLDVPSSEGGSAM